MEQPQILVVEDDGIIALRSQELLSRSGYSVPCPLATGEDALEYIQNGKKPDLILMDIGLMGELDGIATARKVREKYDIPVIFLSAYSNESRIAEAKEVSPCGYIIKPFVENELLSLIQRALGPR